MSDLNWTKHSYSSHTTAPSDVRYFHNFDPHFITGFVSNFVFGVLDDRKLIKEVYFLVQPHIAVIPDIRFGFLLILLQIFFAILHFSSIAFFIHP